MSKWWAWHPVMLESGKIAWMQYVYRKWSWEANPWGDNSGYAGYDGGWVYYEH